MQNYKLIVIIIFIAAIFIYKIIDRICECIENNKKEKKQCQIEKNEEE